VTVALSVATLASDHVVSVTFDAVVSLGTIVTFVIPLVALLTSAPVCATENVLEILVFPKEYTFRIFLLHVYFHTVLQGACP
jgi:hypothetical protein